MNINVNVRGNIMKQHKYETHCHTSEASACGESSASEMVKAYYEAGYSGMCITDHFFNGNTAVDSRLKWKDRVKAFCAGYHEAIKAAKDLDFDVFFGWEYGYHGTDLLTYGLSEEFLFANEDILEWPIEMYFDKVHEAGGIIVHAHPFRERPYIKEIRIFTEYIDAVEVFNSGNDEEVFNTRALEYALKHKLPGTRGSDCHNANNLPGEGVTFNERLTSVEDFIKHIL